MTRYTLSGFDSNDVFRSVPPANQQPEKQPADELKTLQMKFGGALVGSAVGDALGWITEFEKSVSSLVKKYGVEEVTDFVAWEKLIGGRFDGYVDRIEPGEYSDDTQLSLATARSILSGFSAADYFCRREFPLWLDYARGAGGTVKAAAQKCRKRSIRWYNNFFTRTVGQSKTDYRDAGANGAAMRVLPIALAYHRNVPQMIQEIWQNAVISHGHPRAIIGALLYGLTVSRSLNEGLPSDKITSVLAEDILGLTPTLDIPDFHSWLSVWNNGRRERLTFEQLFQAIQGEIADHLRQFDDLLNQPDTEALDRLGCYAQDTKGSGTGTFLAGLYFFLKYRDNLEEAIVRAANSIGSDTDTIASYTGALCGLEQNYYAIPKRWSKRVQDHVYLTDLAKSLAKYVAEGAESSPSCCS